VSYGEFKLLKIRRLFTIVSEEKSLKDPMRKKLRKFEEAHYKKMFPPVYNILGSYSILVANFII
jgi:hypothetical protein